MDIMQRITEIQEEYAQLPQTIDYDLTLESLGDTGDVKVTLKSPKQIIERVIAHNEDLFFITDTFYDAQTLTKGKHLINKSVSEVYFDDFGYLMVVYDDKSFGSTERYKVNPQYKEELIAKLTRQFGDRFGMVKKAEQPKQAKPQNTIVQYEVSYVVDGKRDHFIVESTSLEGARNTALSVVSRRGLDLKQNQVTSKRIY